MRKLISIESESGYRVNFGAKRTGTCAWVLPSGSVCGRSCARRGRAPANAIAELLVAASSGARRRIRRMASLQTALTNECGCRMSGRRFASPALSPRVRLGLRWVARRWESALSPRAGAAACQRSRTSSRVCNSWSSRSLVLSGLLQHMQRWRALAVCSGCGCAGCGCANNSDSDSDSGTEPHLLNSPNGRRTQATPSRLALACAQRFTPLVCSGKPPTT